MPLDSRRINGPENVLSTTCFEKTDLTETLLDANKERRDGRKADELRASVLKLGVSSEAAGSAYFECGNTKILTSVYGPRDVARKSEFSHDGQLYCEFKYTPYSCKVRQPYVPSNEEKAISDMIQQALESAVLLHKFPKSRVEIFIQVLENDGGAIGCALTCAGAALCNAGIEMYDLVVGCTLLQYGSTSLLDPDAKEEAFQNKESLNHGKVLMGMMPNYNQVILLQQDGESGIESLAQCIKNCMSSCQNLVTMVKYFLQKAADGIEPPVEKNNEDGDSR